MLSSRNNSHIPGSQSHPWGVELRAESGGVQSAACRGRRVKSRERAEDPAQRTRPQRGKRPVNTTPGALRAAISAEQMGHRRCLRWKPQPLLGGSGWGAVLRRRSSRVWRAIVLLPATARHPEPSSHRNKVSHPPPPADVSSHTPDPGGEGQEPPALTGPDSGG